MTFYALLQYLRYRRRAQGRHGTHSPFVYGFVEEVLRKKNGTREERILHYTGATAFLPEDAIEDATTDSIILIRTPHASAGTTARWNALRERPEVTLSLDLFHVALLFFRKEFLAKQHFILK